MTTRVVTAFIATVSIAIGLTFGLRVRQRVTTIATIVVNDRIFADSMVTVAGRVRARHASPYIRYKLFELTDGTASIYVIAADSVPFTGDRVRVTGIVRAMNLFGVASLRPVIVEERRSRR